MMHKINVSKALTEEQLLDICKKELDCANCTVAPGPTTEVVYKTSPPTETIAVVVDISSVGGAIKIGEASKNDLGVALVGMVGIEDAKDLVIVPWAIGWWYYTIGSVKIRYIVKV